MRIFSLNAHFLFLALLATAIAPAQQLEIATTVAFTEGPTADADGNVYFTDTGNNRILKLAPNGTLTTFRQPSNLANGLVFDAQWRLVACEAGDPKAETPARVTRTDLKTGKMEVLAQGYEGKPFTAPNDVTFDNRGRLYFTDLPGGAVYRIDTDGKITRILTRPAIQNPNGVMISPDDKTLYLVEANQQANGARMLRAYDLRPDGAVTNMRVFHNFYPGRSADGLCMDSQGNLYAAAGLNSRRGTSETLDTKAGMYMFAPSGKLLEFLPIPEDTLTNCTFGGPDLRTLYVTAGKTLFRMQRPIPGTRR